MLDACAHRHLRGTPGDSWAGEKGEVKSEFHLFEKAEREKDRMKETDAGYNSKRNDGENACGE